MILPAERDWPVAYQRLVLCTKTLVQLQRSIYVATVLNLVGHAGLNYLWLSYCLSGILIFLVTRGQHNCIPPEQVKKYGEQNSCQGNYHERVKKKYSISPKVLTS